MAFSFTAKRYNQESSYSVDDLFIGKVSIVGLYKGKIKFESLKNSFEFFQELGTIQDLTLENKNEVKEVQDSQFNNEENKNNYFFSSSINDSKEFHYIDLLAIIQNVTIPVK